jgi:hypothetical protein
LIHACLNSDILSNRVSQAAVTAASAGVFALEVKARFCI